MRAWSKVVLLGLLSCPWQGSKADLGDGPATGATAESAAMFDPAVAQLDKRTPQWTARDLVAKEQYSAAVDMLEAAVAVAQNPYDMGEQRYLLATSHQRLGHDEQAMNTWAALAQSKHPLAPRANLNWAELLIDSDPQHALAVLDPLQEGQAFSRRAQLLRGMALKAAGRDKEAIAALRKLLRTAPNDRSGAFAAMPLAELLAAQNSTAARVEALELWQRVESRGPTTRVGHQAKMRFDDVIGRVPWGARKKLLAESAEDAFERGQALIRNHEYAAAIEVFARVAGKAKKDVELRCKAQLQQGRALMRKRDREEGAKLMGQVLKRCKDSDLRAWAHYYAGQAYLRLQNPQKALEHYDALSAEAPPHHRLTDDGLYQGALAAADADDRDGMRKRLQQLVDNHPDGDMHREALFTLAWDARGRGDHEAALGYFAKLAKKSDSGVPEGMHGRADYWQARSLQDLGRQEEAVQAYVHVVEQWPLGYHAQLALKRLHALDRKQCQRLQAWLKPEDEKPLLFPMTETMKQPGFAAALSLLRIGETDLAAQEFDAMGLTRRRDKRQNLWLVAALYDAAGAYPEASGLARGRLSSFMNEAPKGEALRRWRIAYPKAYAPLIEEAAAEAHVPAAYVRAVAREESAFDPEAVSSAHAYGLIQLIRPTAKEYAGQLGLPSTPAALKNPQTNLRIGSHYIEFLWNRYKDNPALVPAAYNAGHGAVERWLRAKPDMPLDEFLESIPFSETRRYSRRVLQTYGIYAFLDQGRFPPLREQLPN